LQIVWFFVRGYGIVLMMLNAKQLIVLNPRLTDGFGAMDIINFKMFA